MGSRNQTPPATMNEMIAKLSALSLEEITDIAVRMFHDMSAEGEWVLDAALAVLEAKMSTAEFVRFCDQLAA